MYAPHSDRACDTLAWTGRYRGPYSISRTGRWPPGSRRAPAGRRFPTVRPWWATLAPARSARQGGAAQFLGHLVSSLSARNATDGPALPDAAAATICDVGRGHAGRP